MELRVDVILYSKLGNEKTAGHIKCSRGPHLARGVAGSPALIYTFGKCWDFMSLNVVKWDCVSIFAYYLH